MGERTAARLAVLTALVALALLLKTAVLPAVAVAGWRPDVVALLVASAALRDGPDTGLRLGFAAGLAQDLLSSGSTLVGLWALVLLLGGYVAGLARPYTTAAPLAAGTAVNGGVAAGVTLLYGLLARLLGGATIPMATLAAGTVTVGVYSTAVAPAVLLGVGWLLRAFPPPAQAGRT